jgi:N-acetylneuraminic acid mutarotase
MASCSDYFRSMFTSGMKESTQTEIELKGVSAKGLEKVIEIIYTSNTNFESHNEMFQVISAATHLQCLLAIDYCERNFLSRLNCRNFNRFIQMAKLYGLENALKQIDLFIIRNLAKIINIQQENKIYGKYEKEINSDDAKHFENINDDYYDDNRLSFEQLLRCLKHDELRIKEIDLFYLTWQWINEHLMTNSNICFKNESISTCNSKYNKRYVMKHKKSRIKNMNYLNEFIKTENNLKRKIEIIRSLMSEIRFSLISPDDLVNKVQNVNKIMINDKFLRNMIIKALNYHVLPTAQTIYTHKINQIDNNNEDDDFEYDLNLDIRSPIKCILTIGGREINPNPSLHDGCYLLNEYCESNNNNQKTISVGNNFQSLNNSNKSIINRTNLCNLPNVLSHMQCVVLDSNFLYVIGGCISQCAHGESAVNTTYRYDPRLNKWINVCPMLEKRAYFYSCCLNVTSNILIGGSEQTSKQYIFSIGGKNKDGALLTIEKYDVENNVWSYAQSLPSTYYAHAGCVMDNKAYISGGYSHGHFTGHLNVYIPNNNQWEELRPMNSPRGWHCMCRANGNIFVFGGCYLNTSNPQLVLNPQQYNNIQAQQLQQQMAQPVLVTEYYTPSIDQWTIVKPMINLHKEASCFKINNHIYIIGGYNIQTKTGQKFISRYDYINDLWQTVGQMNTGMTGFGINY